MKIAFIIKITLNGTQCLQVPKVIGAICGIKSIYSRIDR